MEILSKLFPRWIARKKQVDVALELIEYIQRLFADAMLRSGLADEAAEKFKRDGTLTGLEHVDLGLTPHAQLFMFNLIAHACQKADLEEDQIGGVLVYVMGETLHAKPDDVNGAMLGYLKWFTDVASEINVAEKAGDPVPDEVDHRVFLESSVAAARLVRAMGTDDAAPTDAEAEFFTSLCAPLPAEA